MTINQAHRKLLIHQRMARVLRQDGREREAQVALRRAAKCQAVLQVARMEEGETSWDAK